MKKILFLGHSGLAGGAEFMLETTLRFLDRERFSPTVFFGTDGPMVARAGMTAEVVPFSWWMLYTPSFWEWKNRLRIPLRVWRLVNFIRREKIDLVYTNTACIFEGALAARLAGVPHVTHVHEILREEHMRPRWFSLGWMTRFLYRNSRRVIFGSDAAAEVARRWIPAKMQAEFEAKTRVVFNSSRFSAAEREDFDREKARREWGISPEKTVFLWIGRFSPRKNPKMLVEAVAKMWYSGRAEILLVGEGSLEKDVREMIAEKGLENVCRVLPFQDDIRPLLAAGDVMTLTSTEELFGLVLVEAGIFGLPLIATRTEGPTHIIENEKTGYLVNVGDVSSLAEKMDAMIENPGLRKEMGAKMRLRVQEFFDPAKNTRKIEAILMEILD